MYLVFAGEHVHDCELADAGAQRVPDHHDVVARVLLELVIDR